MVWQSYNKQEVPKGFALHHLNHDCYDNRIQNIILLTRGIHSTFEAYWNMYSKKSDFYTSELKREDFVQKINNFDISDELKQKLIDSI